MDLIPDYVKRKKGLAKVKAPHKLLEGVTKETYGVLIYQEQVMQAAQVMAGYSLGGADLLRRAMGKKDKEKMAKERIKFCEGAAKLHGIKENVANEIFDTLEKFASINHDSGAVLSLSNPFAAVPSVHTCFSLIIGLSCFFLVKWRPLGIAWLFYPALIIFSIVATGNHFWLDAILGAGVAVIAFLIARAIERVRPTLPESARRRLRIDRPAASPAG